MISDQKLPQDSRKITEQIIGGLTSMDAATVRMSSHSERAAAIRSIKIARQKIQEAIFWFNDALEVDDKTF